MKFEEPEGGGKSLIKFIIYGAIALDILYGMATGSGAFTYNAANMNTSNTLVILIGGTIVLVLFFLGIAFKFL